MNQNELDAIRDRHNAATPGPWIASLEGRDHWAGSDFIITGVELGQDIWVNGRRDFELLGASKADLDFIANARQDIPQLLAYIATLEAEISKCRENSSPS